MSGFRKFFDQIGKCEFSPLERLSEARKTSNSYLIMEGDDGGQIYLTIPVSHIKVDEPILQELLNVLDSMMWNDESSKSMYFEVRNPGDLVLGGMGGGKIEEGLWVHDKLKKYKNKIQDVLEGKLNPDKIFD